MPIELEQLHHCHGGRQGFYRHRSAECGGPMGFSVFIPPHSTGDRLPVLYYLSGLTCGPDVFPIKAGAQRLAAELGLMLVCPDTSPRDTGIKGATGDWEFGEGAGFYLDATKAPWAERFRMYSYVTRELPALIEEEFPVDPGRVGIFGHSMGGHGALVLGLRNPERYRSISAFAPIVAPTEVPWGHKALPRYLGEDRDDWARYDACHLVRQHPRRQTPILIDQGLDDPFLAEQLRPERFETACEESGQPLELRRHTGYDHGYFFIQSFIDDHLRHHAEQLRDR
jgi:S-formylglutathione hydrolase